MKKLLILIAFLIFASLANAQTKPEPEIKLLPTDTIILRATRTQIGTVIQLVQQAINLSYNAKLDSEKASIPVFLLQAMEALNGIKIEDAKADSISKAKTK